MEVAINLTAIIISTVSLLVALASLAMVIGMKLSTHRIEWKPLEINDPFKQEEEFKPFAEADEDLIAEARRLAEEGKKKKKETDPLDEILESSNF